MRTAQQESKSAETAVEKNDDGDQREILAGLQQPQKTISPKFFYDEIGSKLFDEICQQPEYYLTRTELGIMDRHIGEIVKLIGPRASIIEFGSGSSLKTRLLLENLVEPAAYMPVDISREHLSLTARNLTADFPDIEILPVCADFTRPFDLPVPALSATKNIIFFPGSTLGNFSTGGAVDLMRVMRTEANNNGELLIGIDLKKPRDILEPAYNDAAGVTAKFNLNLLARFNREYGADFDPDSFRHEAVYDDEQNRIEMRLISLCRQTVQFCGSAIDLAEGEYIVTEHSYKYPPDRFDDMARQAGFEPCQTWSDPDNLFSVRYLAAAPL